MPVLFLYQNGGVIMWQFILGLFVGANVSLILYALIIAGRRGDTENEWRK